MTIDKAIEILELECTSHKLKSDPDYLASARLGIEALKYVKTTRGTSRGAYSTLLPGEAHS